jgi:hypothetical protein
MRNSPNVRVESHRLTTAAGHPLASDSSHGNNGVFFLRYKGVLLWCMVSDQLGWDHVSVHPDTNPPRCCSWEEMSWVKSQFFYDNETVVQFHPRKADYISDHPTTLHLWKKQDQEHELPPWQLVGRRDPSQTVEDLARSLEGGKP